MDHLIHPFIPGTPENAALMAMVPALVPMFDQAVCWCRNCRSHFKGSHGLVKPWGGDPLDTHLGNHSTSS